MSVIIPAGYANAAFRFSLTGDPEVMVSTMGYDLNAVTGQSLADSLATGFTAAAAFPAANILTGYTFLGVRVAVGQDGGPPVIFESPVSVVGTNLGPPFPSNVSLLVRKITALGGRRGRGRMYFPPAFLGEDSISSIGIIAEAQRGPLSDRFFAATAAPAGATRVLLHGPEVGAPTAPTPITNVILDRLVATQRRRLRR
jgi:hypothetical protein